MNKRTYISESEKSQILTLHESVRNENNYFETLENKIQKVLFEQHEPPKLQPGQSMTEDGKILSVKKVKKPDLLLDGSIKFPPGKWEPFNLTEQQKKEIKNWFADIEASKYSIDVTVMAGSSKSGPDKRDEEGRRQYNIELAGKRATVGLNTIKSFLDSILDPEILSLVNYKTDISYAHQGPEYIPGKNKSSESQYQTHQFVNFKIHATGELDVLQEESPQFQPWKVVKVPGFPNIGIVSFCVSGIKNHSDGQYRCPDNGYKILYYSNTDDKVQKGSTRWIPIAPEDAAKGIVYAASQAQSGKGIFKEKGSFWCFQYESGNKNENCKTYYNSWPNYSYRWKEGKEGTDWSLPGKEVGDDMYKQIIENWGTTYAKQ